MKQGIYSIGIILIFIFSCLTATAGERLTCDELTDLANDLDGIAVAFDNVGTITEGDEIDRALGEIVDVIILVADIENEAAMNNAVDSLISAYDSFNSEKFALSLDSVILNLDRFYRRDCE